MDTLIIFAVILVVLGIVAFAIARCMKSEPVKETPKHPTVDYTESSKTITVSRYSSPVSDEKRSENYSSSSSASSGMDDLVNTVVIASVVETACDVIDTVFSSIDL